MSETAIVGPDQLANQIQMLADKGVTPEVLAGYMELWERADAKRAESDFNDALRAVQMDMPPVVADGYNPETKGNYPKMETVLRTVKPVLFKHGFSMTRSAGEPLQPEWVRVLVTLSHTGGHSRTYHKDGPMDNVGPKGGPTKTKIQGMESAAAYLERRLIVSILGMTVAGDDDDGREDAKTITEEQAIRLSEMFEGFDDDKRDGELRRFLAWLHVERIADIPASRHSEAESALRGALAKRGGGR